jgi:hypothetical protein
VSITCSLFLYLFHCSFRFTIAQAANATIIILKVRHQADKSEQNVIEEDDDRDWESCVTTFPIPKKALEDHFSSSDRRRW